MSARYLIGIDLGTTNSAVAYVDLNREKNPSLSIQHFPILQLSNKGTSSTLASLPSYCYLMPDGNYALPWRKDLSYIVGQLALDEGTQIPGQLVHSAKSWLCHPHARLKSSLLPENASARIGRISPLEASARYLSHIREAWNYTIAKNNPDLEFESQEIVLTIPASFDETARGLTLEAARLAGFKSLVLLEEPQAAFYCWMANNEKKFDRYLKHDDIVLVVDIGGGTTDFSLIQVKKKEELFTFDRVAVGDHLLLGGDNMDAAMAHLIETKLKDGCDYNHFLKFAARKAKETLLSDQAPASYKVLLQGRGSAVVRNTHSVEITKDEVSKLLHDGFFGMYSYEEAKNALKKQALKTIGLSFESEPSITKHLAQFLDKAGKQPNKVLFNGGALKPYSFRKAIMDSLNSWFPERTVSELETESYDLAVAKGAAQFSKVRNGHSLRIGGGSPRSYYAEVNCNGTMKAMTVLERGAEEDKTYKAPFSFHLLPNTPVTFKVYASHTRMDDKLGDFADVDLLEMLPLPALQTVLKFGQTKQAIPVNLEAKFTSIGILELGLYSQQSDHRWHLEFSTGKENTLSSFSTNSRIDETYEANALQPALEYLDAFFFGGRHKEKFMEELEKILQKQRHFWPLSVLRKFADHLLKYKNLPKARERYWNALGYFLRPGYGFPLDEFRMKELWKVILAEFQDKNVQKWICYRRIAGGLGKGQQIRIAQEMLDDSNWKIGKLPLFKQKEEAYFFTEKLRAIASLEWLESSKKIALGNAIVNKIVSESCSLTDAYILGRLGARNLLYAPFTQVINKSVIEVWLSKLLNVKDIDRASFELICMQLARISPHYHLNISKDLTKKITTFFSDNDRLKNLLQEEVSLNAQEHERLFADELPIGLILKTVS